MPEDNVLFGDRAQKSDHDALVLAWKTLGVSDPQLIAREAMAEWDGAARAVSVRVLDRRVTAWLGEEKVAWENGAPVFPPMHLLVLHYLERGREVEPSGELIGFRELEGGNVYFSAFEAQSIRPLTRAFGPDPKMLLAAGKTLGAEPYRLGHACVKVPLFPRVPIYAVVWAGDDEVPASSNFLFDATIRQQMHTEDVAVSCSVLGSMLRKAAEKL